MTGSRLLKKLKQKVERSGWLSGTTLNFAHAYLDDAPASVPLGLLLAEDALVQIRRKFFYPLETIGEALSENSARWNHLDQAPVFQPVIDADYEWQTIACLIWNNEIIISISERASDFWFDSETDMANFLEEKYQEGATRLQELLSGHVNESPNLS
jgi:hypothetical protein